jgi:DNA-binding CsgD family transcriptional regulator
VLEATLGFLAGDAPAVAADDGPPLDDLSAREREVLRLVAAGLSDRQIAGVLVLSPHTVHRHVANIRTKLRLPTRAAAAAEAVRLGVV